eukprot:TRINITY_DN49150_c0_g1_i1.p1 TRINITY_DN49150_c0_g1~~TRINITY_DN49150_c0_g1_i1.p1  ORF type:complete len:344 (-),score=47.56 TRINITY_DN49150_c0_g1_i1:473-1402(-)
MKDLPSKWLVPEFVHLASAANRSYQDLNVARRSASAPDRSECVAPTNHSEESRENLTHMRRLNDNVVSFQLFTPAFCRMLLQEMNHFEKWLHSSAFGATTLSSSSESQDSSRPDPFDVMGLQWIFAELSQKYLKPLANAVMGDRDPGNLDTANAHIVVRHANRLADVPSIFQKSTDAHQDSSVITVNTALSDAAAGDFSDSHIYYCGEFGSADYREHKLTVDMTKTPPGAVMMHSGLLRHATSSVESGVRTNMVIWIGSSQYSSRDSGIVSAGTWETAKRPDALCLADDDADYCLHASCPGGRRRDVPL